MKNSEMESKIKRAYSLATPDIKNAVISAATDESKKERAFIMTIKNNKNKMIKAITAISAAAAMLAICVFGGIYYSSNYITDSTVSLDVNPSIEIKLSKNNTVLDVLAKNDDGELIVGDMEYKGAEVDTAVNALVSSMIENGYISELANSVLISVDGDGDESEAELKAKIVSSIEALLAQQSIDGAILSQSVEATDEIKALSDKYGVTVGKVQLISKIVSTSDMYKFEELVQLSINELNLISKNAENLENVEVKGEASDKSYIGIDMALQIALSEAGLNGSDVTKIETELDFEKGVMVYEVEFNCGETEYEYEINAVTGELVDFESEVDDDDDDDTPVDVSKLIGEDKAKEIVFTHAGFTVESVTDVKTELESDDGVAKYEIEFKANGNEYDYDINAYTGTIIKFKQDKDGEHKDDDKVTVDTANCIGEEKAKEIALADAQLSAENVIFKKAVLDIDDGMVNYEVKFKANGIKYEYDIDAYTGAIVEVETDDEKDNEKDDEKDNAEEDDKDEDKDEEIVADENMIGEDAAKQKALDDSAVSVDVAVFKKVKLDKEDGKIVYEIEFKADGVEYEYDIDAYTGEILKADNEIDDKKDEIPADETVPADSAEETVSEQI